MPLCGPTGTPEPTPTVPCNPTPTILEPSPTTVPLPTATLPSQEEGGIGGSSDGGGTASAPVCTDAVPPRVYLRDLKLLGNGKVSLLWDSVDLATHYSISYGASSGKYLYGVVNTGRTNSFTVGELGAGSYCFVVKGVNNCMPGEFSNELCISQAGKVLGASVLGATGSFNDNLLYFSRILQTSVEIPNQKLPKKIVISSAGIDLPVFPARVVLRDWEISEIGASYLLGSGTLGKPGNIVIYGHNKKTIFGPILSLKKGAEIKIEDDKGSIFKYEIMETKIVSPENIEVLNPTKDETLTLYTCAGNFDLKRFIVIAKKI